MSSPETKIVYELRQQDFSRAIQLELAKLKKDAVLGRYQDRLISVDTAADIHGVHRDTIVKYAKAGLIPHQMKGKLYKFSLAEILQLDFNQLRQRA